MTHVLLVALGGAIGSVARYLTNQLALRLFGPAFPWGTFVVNGLGSLAMGLLAELIVRRYGGSAELRLFLLTGLLGGFTTFSAFSLDVAVLVERGALLSAFAYIGLTLVVSLAGVFAGLAMGRALL